ncbi:hypothetical protein ACFLRA_02800 [Bdellovibrionota bacterium]
MLRALFIFICTGLLIVPGMAIGGDEFSDEDRRKALEELLELTSPDGHGAGLFVCFVENSERNIPALVRGFLRDLQNKNALPPKIREALEGYEFTFRDGNSEDANLPAGLPAVQASQQDWNLTVQSDEPQEWIIPLPQGERDESSDSQEQEQEQEQEQDFAHQSGTAIFKDGSGREVMRAPGSLSNFRGDHAPVHDDELEDSTTSSLMSEGTPFIRITLEEPEVTLTLDPVQVRSAEFERDSGGTLGGGQGIRIAGSGENIGGRLRVQIHNPTDQPIRLNLGQVNTIIHNEQVRRLVSPRLVGALIRLTSNLRQGETYEMETNIAITHNEDPYGMFMGVFDGEEDSEEGLSLVSGRLGGNNNEVTVTFPVISDQPTSPVEFRFGREGAWEDGEVSDFHPRLVSTDLKNTLEIILNEDQGDIAFGLHNLLGEALREFLLSRITQEGRLCVPVAGAGTERVVFDGTLGIPEIDSQYINWFLSADFPICDSGLIDEGFLDDYLTAKRDGDERLAGHHVEAFRQRISRLPSSAGRGPSEEAVQAEVQAILENPESETPLSFAAAFSVEKIGELISSVFKANADASRNLGEAEDASCGVSIDPTEFNIGNSVPADGSALDFNLSSDLTISWGPFIECLTHQNETTPLREIFRKITRLFLPRELLPPGHDTLVGYYIKELIQWHSDNNIEEGAYPSQSSFRISLGGRLTLREETGRVVPMINAIDSTGNGDWRPDIGFQELRADEDGRTDDSSSFAESMVEHVVAGVQGAGLVDAEEDFQNDPGLRTALEDSDVGIHSLQRLLQDEVQDLYERAFSDLFHRVTDVDEDADTVSAQPGYRFQLPPQLLALARTQSGQQVLDHEGAIDLRLRSLLRLLRQQIEFEHTEEEAADRLGAPHRMMFITVPDRDNEEDAHPFVVLAWGESAINDSLGPVYQPVEDFGRVISGASWNDQDK